MTTKASGRSVHLDAGTQPGRVQHLWHSHAAQRFRANLRKPRFWVVQGMVFFVTLGHLFAELFFDPHLGAAYFIPASLTFFPILYASLNFGREGAIPTAIWSGALAIPNLVILHDGLERVGELFQVVTMILLAIVVASKIDKEQLLERARLASERRYRGLFEAAGEPILAFDAEGAIHEANAAAEKLLGRAADGLRGDSIEDLIGLDANQLRSIFGDDVYTSEDIGVIDADGNEIWLQPVCTVVTTETGSLLTQAILRDVTERREFQRFAREVVRAQEEERARISRDLHDVSLQSAVLICRSLDSATEVAEAGEKGALTRILSDARALAEEMGDDLRRFSRELRPTILEDLGLAPALRRLVTEFADRTGIDGQITLRGDSRPLADHHAELAFFRITQEALRNAERHSGASEARVVLQYDSDRVTVTISDNGRGFSVSGMDGAATAGHLGLLGMRERASLVGGHCTIQSRPAIGTVVEAHVPAAHPV